MLKIITLIPTTFIIICLLGNQAISKTTDVDKFLNKTSLTPNKNKISLFKKSKFTSELTPKKKAEDRRKEAEEKKKINPKTLISQLKKRRGIKLIAGSKTYPQEKDITQIQTSTQTLKKAEEKRHSPYPPLKELEGNKKLNLPETFDTFDSLIPSQPTYAQNTPINPPRPPENPRPDPNRDRFLQPLPQPDSPETPKEEELQKPPPSQPLPDEPTQQIPVQRILINGSTILTPEEINTLVGPLEGRLVTLLELRQVADKITEIYLERGYITSRAILPAQTITEGVVRIEVVEGVLGEIEIEGTKRLHNSYIESRIRLGVRKPLDTARLENQLRLLRANPLFENIEASLRASDTPGESILIVRVTETNPLELSMNADNYSPPTVGSERTGWTALHRNLTGRGDFFVASYNTTRLFDDESDVFDIIYNLPINAMNGTLQVRAAPNGNEIDFEGLDISGTTDVYEFSYRQPIFRNPRQEFAFSVGLTYQRTETLFDDMSLTEFDPTSDEDAINSTTVIRLGQDYIRRDPLGAWALRSQFNIGTGLFDATVREDPEPDGHFFSWLGQVQRVQRLSNNHLLIVQGDLQLSSTAVLPYQQFIIGGALSLRGYRQNVRSGDNGFRFSIEDRITVYRDESGLPLIQFTPFIDIGAVWNDGSNPNNDFLPDDRFLAGAGIGLIWQPVPEVDLRLDYGFPLVHIDDRGNNAQDSGFYFSVIVRPF
ncbi:MAG: ShlB/FhaC/HecB family hemolysin secretion/activation protein [Okeania sp. SIO3I5]|uniref:ShlB/FhaC/HecB family hemolysin secretion/activation protein n=1 Tax=Okeania sp. SIO3I5 TaxID=2607805 RepID=UPI0013B97FEA|nr:ShlB/FhaC/HecB family hemolysin secretion/activation protein [Okeania sp. SIO3I5]NEQ41277.1 ShlB/FhaC/HecB family hemolysin secretion/activation protein [Okeania sp. SIO3I5]